MAKLISKTYGEALFEVAMEGQKTDLFLQEAQDILTILDQNPELDKLMKHPKVSRQDTRFRPRYDHLPESSYVPSGH